MSFPRDLKSRQIFNSFLFPDHGIEDRSLTWNSLDRCCFVIKFEFPHVSYQCVCEGCSSLFVWFSVIVFTQTRILSPHHHFLDTWLISKILKISIEKKTPVEDLFCWFAFLSSRDALAVKINIHVLITIWLTKQMFYQIVWYYQLLNDRNHDSEFGRLNNSSGGNKF